MLRVISSNTLRSIKRTYYAFIRLFTRGVPQLEVFLKIDDPYSLLLVQALPTLEKKYRVAIIARVIINSDPVMFPERYSPSSKTCIADDDAWVICSP
jgi:hypothetical protein